ncbi:restriction endonuclease [Enterococcus florum]|uniref:restriction endonuclease n=1 Tax=Enterococcus florum TaxID=2480627 RepID=UPI0011BA69F0
MSKVIQEINSGQKYYSFDKSVVITNNYYTLSAKELAKIANVELWDRETLKDLLSENCKGVK